MTGRCRCHHARERNVRCSIDGFISWHICWIKFFHRIAVWRSVVQQQLRHAHHVAGPFGLSGGGVRVHWHSQEVPIRGGGGWFGTRALQEWQSQKLPPGKNLLYSTEGWPLRTVKTPVDLVPTVGELLLSYLLPRLDGGTSKILVIKSFLPFWMVTMKNMYKWT